MPAKSLQTLVKQRYLNALHTVQPASRWKNLVVDAHTMEYMNAVMRMFDILEQNVTKVDRIEKHRDPEPGIETAYILCPTTQNVNRIIQDMTPTHDRPALYDAAHVFFVDAISDELVTKLTNSKAGIRLKQLVELFINLWPVESQAFLLKHPSSFFSVFQPMDTKFCPSLDEALALMQDELDISTQAILNVCITLNENPLIRYLHVPGRVLGPLSPEALSDTVEGSFAVDDFSKSDIAGRVQIGVPFPQQLAHRVQAALDDYTKNQMLGDPGRPRGVLFITDRTMDLVSPFLHEFTYQAMVYDLVPIQDNTYKHTYKNAEGITEELIAELNDSDEIWTRIRHMHVAEAIQYLTREFKQHMGEASQFSGEMSFNGMRDMLVALPHMQQTKEKLSVHLSLAQLCMDKFEHSKLAAQAMVEQNAATGQTPDGSRPRSLVEDMVPILDDPSITNADKVRIIALYILSCDGVQEEDCRRLFQHARLTGGETATVTHLTNLGARVVREPSSSSLDAIFRKRRKTLQPRLPAAGQAEYELSRWQPLLRTLLEDHLLGRLEQSMFPYVRDAPPEIPLSEQISQRSMSFSASATGMATSVLHSAINATGGKDSPLARVGAGFGFDQSSSTRSNTLRGGTTSLRSARPTWHQKGRSQSVASLSTSSANSGGAGAGGVTTATRNTSSALQEMSNPSAQRMLVFMVGGITYSEMRTAYEVGKRNNTEVYLGSSHVFTPTSYMEALRVMGTPRQPIPPDLHVDVRRKAQQAEQEQLLAQQQGKKIKQPHILKKPKYPQDLPPQDRYDLRNSTAEEAPPPPPMPEKNSQRLVNKLHKGHDAQPNATPSQNNSSKKTSGTSTSDPNALPEMPSVMGKHRFGRDMSKFKHALFHKK